MSKGTTVTIYSAPWCAFCRMAKQYLDSKKIEYKEINVDEDQEGARAMVAKTGQAGIPVLEIGEATIIGFDRPRIDSALEQYNLV
ncbi:MAG TPA: glutaredoxin family protein [Candidatus Saccharimonadales bacterium]|nr:glutaredoxin family protein [Candidatus Saccharimonadales bacterium]